MIGKRNNYKKNGGYNQKYAHREITPREILVSVIIIILVIFLGVPLVSALKRGAEERNEVYYKAVKIDNDAEMFNYAQKTDAGNALVYSDVRAKDTVSMPEILSEFLYLERVKERYTMHTRTVTKTDSKGKTYTTTEIYYTWDTVNRQSLISNEIEIFENSYSTNLFYFYEFSRRLQLDNSIFNKVNGLDKVKNNYIYDGDKIRYYYNYVPTNFTSNYLLNFKNNTINAAIGERIAFNAGTIEQRIDELEKSVNTVSIVVWVFLILAAILGVVYFIFEYHPWLERD